MCQGCMEEQRENGTKISQKEKQGNGCDRRVTLDGNIALAKV